MAAACLALDFPTIASVPHSLVNGYKNVLAVAVETDYTFPLAEKVRPWYRSYFACMGQGGTLPWGVPAPYCALPSLAFQLRDALPSCPPLPPRSVPQVKAYLADPSAFAAAAPAAGGAAPAAAAATVEEEEEEEVGEGRCGWPGDRGVEHCYSGALQSRGKCTCVVGAATRCLGGAGEGQRTCARQDLLDVEVDHQHVSLLPFSPQDMGFDLFD